MRYVYPNLPVQYRYSTFKSYDGLTELHLIMEIEPGSGGLFEEQYNHIVEAQKGFFSVLNKAGEHYNIVFKRYFLSDAANQMPLIAEAGEPGVSCIQQPPLNGTKVAVWVYAVWGAAPTADADGTITLCHNGYEMMWNFGMISPEGDSEAQTRTLLERYEAILGRRGANIADDCIRTWFYVRDVDSQYAGMVKARRENFEQNGLTPSTHYLSSTGIGGAPAADCHALIQLGAMAIKGLKPGQQQYLYALTHLNKTIDYGVTFERGTTVDFGDRRHAYISGTASIDNKGDILFPGDIVRQTRRMWENVEALLLEAFMDTYDIMQMVVYLRDPADYQTVQSMFSEKFERTPYVIVLAPVCRPGWLIEMECIAVSRPASEGYEPM